MIALSTLLNSSLLSDLRVYDVQGSKLTAGDESPLSTLAAKSVATGTAELLTPDASDNLGFGAAVAIPVYKAGNVVSIAVMAIEPKSVGAGVFELWEPVGVYEEVRLRAGYFAHLERFSNVSSFVRFEKGSGLPGQAWAGAKGIIHDDLANHPGFLRAAGASAGLLQTAIGIPVISSSLKSVAVLISSDANPLAKGYEIWVRDGDEFTLDSCAYQGVSEAARLTAGTKLSSAQGLPGQALSSESAVSVEPGIELAAGRDSSEDDFAGGLAIPFFDGDQLTSVTTLLF